MNLPYREFNATLHRFYRRYLTLTLYYDFLLVAGLWLILMQALGFLDFHFIWPATGKWLSAGLWWLLLCYLLYHRFFIPFGAKYRFRGFLIQAEKQYSDHHNFLQNSYDLPREYPGTDEKLTQLLIQRTQQKLADFSPRVLIPALFRKSYGWIFLTGLLLFLIPLIFIDDFGIHYQRILAPWNQNLIPRSELFRVTPGDTTILKNSTIRIRAISHSPQADMFWLDYKPAQSETFQSERMTKDSAEIYYFDLRALRQDTEYRVRNRFSSSRTYRLSLTDFPEISSITFEIIPPAYTQQTKQILHDVGGDLIALKGSIIHFELVPTKPLKEAQLVFNDSSISKLMIADMRITGELDARINGSFYYNFIDTHDLRTPNPVRYYLNIQPDLYPMVRLIFPGRDIDLTEEMIVPIQVFASDDYGLSQLELHYWLNDRNEQTARISIPLKSGEKETVSGFVWDLRPENLMVEDVVSYYICAFDNDRISGPKKSMTQVYTLRFPSVFEIMAEIEKAQEENITAMEKNYRDMERMQKQLDEYQQALKKENQLSWEQQQDIMNQVDRLQEKAGETQKATENIEELIQKMEENQTLTEQTMTKMKEIEKILKEIDPQRLQKLLDQMKQNMNDPQKMQQALENLRKDQQDFMQKLDRTLALLKKMQAEQKLSEMEKKLDAMEKSQAQIEEKLKKESENSNPPSTPQDTRQDLQKKQEQLKDQAQNLKQDMKDLEQLLKESKSQFEKEAQNLQKEMDTKQMQQQMQDIQQQMQNQQMKSAQKMSQKLRQDMKEMKNSMSKMRQNMEMADIMQLMAKLEQMYQNLLHTSGQQEELNQQFERNRNAAENNPNRQNQQQDDIYQTVRETTDSVMSWSKVRTEITGRSLQALGISMMAMQEALNENVKSQSFQPGQNPQQSIHRAQQARTLALEAINQAAMEMYQNIQNMQQSKKQCSNPMPMPMAGMQQMSSMQQQINQSLQELMNRMGMGNGKLSVQQQQRLKQMALQQSEIARQLQEYMQQMEGKDEPGMGRMNQTVEDMKQSALDMENQKIDQPLMERNQRILSRMLDSEKSLREREMSKKRKAETGIPLTAVSPAELSEQILNDQNLHKLMILQALKEKYPASYDLLIKSYFNQLMNHFQNQTQSPARSTP